MFRVAISALSGLILGALLVLAGDAAYQHWKDRQPIWSDCPSLTRLAVCPDGATCDCVTGKAEHRWAEWRAGRSLADLPRDWPMCSKEVPCDFRMRAGWRR